MFTPETVYRNVDQHPGINGNESERVNSYGNVPDGMKGLLRATAPENYINLHVNDINLNAMVTTFMMEV